MPFLIQVKFKGKGNYKVYQEDGMHDDILSRWELRMHSTIDKLLLVAFVDDDYDFDKLYK